MSYVPLGIRTEYSFGRSMCRPGALVERALSLQLPAVGVADTHGAWALPSFIAAARAAGIRPLVAVRIGVHMDAVLPQPAQLTLHVMDATGLANLIHLVNLALRRAAGGDPALPGITLEELNAARAGLLALDGAEDGPIGRLLQHGRIDDAVRAAAELKNVFSPGQFFVEVRRSGADPRRLLEPHTIRIARILNLPIVATTDVRYLDPHDACAFDVLQRLPLPGEPVELQDAGVNRHAHLRSAGEMQRLFADLPEALEATFLVAEKCSLPADALMPPTADTDRGAHAALTERCERAACERSRASAYVDVPAAVRDRIAEELTAIEEANLASCFLLAGDVARHAVREQIPIGPGPGTAAGSFVAFLLGLSEVDPLQFGLHFRAAGLAAHGMPGEIQLSAGHRGWAELRRVAQASRHCVLAQMATVAQRSGVALARDVARVLQLTEAESRRVEELVMARGTAATAAELPPGWSHRSSEGARVDEAVAVCGRLGGLPYHAFPRAGSLLVLPQAHASRLVVEPDGDHLGMVQLTERDAEALGWLRLELRAARHLTTLTDAATWTAKRGVPFTLAGIPLDDERTFRKLSHADTSCVMHLEDALTQRVLALVQPARLTDLADVLALCTQARAGHDQTQLFGARRSGQVSTPTEAQHVFASTQGLVLYQEQVFELAVRVAGMDAAAAQAWSHSLRTRDHARTRRLQRDFIVGALESGSALAEAEALFAQVARWQPLPSRAHCLSMALTAYRAAYLWVHHGREFMFALMRNSHGQLRRQGRLERLLGAGERTPAAAAGYAPRQGRGRTAQLQLAFAPGAPEQDSRAVRTSSRPARVGLRPRVWIAGQIRARG